MSPLNRNILAPVFVGAALLLAGCEGDDANNSAGTIDVGMPEGFILAMLDSTDGAFHAYDSTSKQRIDLNAKAAASQDESIQNMRIDSVADIGHFLHWPDSGEEHDHVAKSEGDEHEEAELEQKFLLMQPNYQRGSAIDSDSFSVLVHLHDDELAGHTASEYASASEGSALAEELERLNLFVTEQQDLHDELSEALPTDQTLCRAFVDPYLHAEHAHEEEQHANDEVTPAKTEEMHEGELIHYALTDSGRVYFFEEDDGALEEAQSHIDLTDVITIADCDRTTIARASDEGILIYVPDTQYLYLVDAHEGSSFHQHSRYDVSRLVPAGESADLMAIVGEGDDHDHDHEHQ